ncbi:MAG: cyclase family protein [Deltaproteobacteria bacterium]|nr:cyclase family protein [Deltaproteobacteria bacterium]
MAEISDIAEETKTIYDISPEISERSAVFPGDCQFKRSVALDFKKGDNLVLSSITTTVHIGAHTDAPSHYHRDGAGIEARDLSYYLGPCQVISVSLPRSERILPENIAKVVIRAKRVLFKTRSFPDPDNWNSDFNSLSAGLVEVLASRGVCLVGIDTPSIDPSADQMLESHNTVFKHGMAILEGIVLDRVPDGIYHLVALPLKIKGADASPVRAVLWKS